MRKLLPLIIVVVIAAVAGGYWFTWNQKASKLKEDIETMITALNGDQKYITYESIKTSGFPKDITVTITKPVANVPLTNLLAKFMGPEFPSQVFSVDGMAKNWVEKYELANEIVVGSDVLGKHLFFSINGPITSTNSMEGKEDVVVESAMASPLTCELYTNESVYSSKFKELIEQRDSNPGALFGAFKSFECKNEGVTMTRKGSASPLYSAGPSRLYFAAEPKGGLNTYHFVLKGKDMKATEEMDALINRYHDGFGEANRHMIGNPTKLSIHGNQNIDIDFTVALTPDFDTTGQGSFAIDTASALYTSDIMKSTGDFDISVNKNDSATDANLKIQSTSTVTPTYDEVFRSNLVDMMDSLLSNPLLRGESMVETLSTLTPEQRDEIAQKITPKVSDLGEMKVDFRVAFNAKGDIAKNPFVPGNISIDAFDITTTPYGLTTNGKLDMPAPMQPVGKVKIQLLNASKLVDDTVAYIRRVQETVATFDAEAAKAMDVPEGLVTGIKHFLYETSSTKDANYTYEVESAADGNITISGKSIMEVSDLFGKDILAQLPMPTPGSEEGTLENSEAPEGESPEENAPAAGE